MRRLDRAVRGLMYALPVAVLFSYYPVISFGGNEAMNLEISLTVLWLVVFDVVAVLATFSAVFGGFVSLVI